MRCVRAYTVRLDCGVIALQDDRQMAEDDDDDEDDHDEEGEDQDKPQVCFFLIL